MPNPVSTHALEPALEIQPEGRPAVLLLGCAEGEVQELRDRAGLDYDVLTVGDSERAAQLLASRRISVLCLGDRLEGDRARQILELLIEGLPMPPPLNIVLASGPDPTIFQDLISDDRIFYLTRRPPAAEELAALLRSAVQRFQSHFERLQGLRINQETRALSLQREIAEALRRLALEGDTAEKGVVLSDTVQEITRADRAYCLFYDPSDETLWTRDPVSRDERRESAAVGLTSFVVRSGISLQLARVGQDPRHDRDADDPAGDGGERFLAVPILATTGRAVAVLVAVRKATAPEFQPEDRQALEQLATLAAPDLAAHLQENGGESGGLVAALAGLQGDLFRKEALDHHLQASDANQEPLMLSPAWTRWTYWLLLAMLVVSLVYSLVGEVHEYASGLGVVWTGGRSDLTAVEPGTVASIEVDPGEHVQAGQVLMRFHEKQEAAELDRIEQEFEMQLTNRLRDPSDPGAEQALLNLRAQRELGRARLEQRTLRAPVAGTVSDLRAQPGQYATPGQVLASILHDGEQADPKVVILLPGEYRPQIRPGMLVRFEISGYRYAYQALKVRSVGDEVVGPNEARRYLGPGLADSVTVGGPVVVVEADLPSDSFQAEGKTYRYHNGMNGIAEVRVRSEKILFTLVPGLKALFNDV
jgi:multidrug efflux pump subunit AcrA (membrane-fusion protein)